METDFSDTIANGEITLPLRYLSLKHAYVDGSPTQSLERVSSQQVYRKYPVRSGQGKPCLIAVETSNFIFGPFPDQGYTIKGIYYRKYASLSDSNTTNWYITDAPEVLLYGALLEATPFIGDDIRIQTWQALFSEALDTIVGEKRIEEHSGGTLRTRVA